MRFLLIIATIILASLHAQAEETPCSTPNNVFKSNGACWRSLSMAAKAAAVRGMIVGMEARTLADKLIGHQTEYFSVRDYLDMPEHTTIGDVVDYFDQLYETPANRSIRWPYALLLAAMKARDDDSDDRLALIKLLREFHDIPTRAYLVDVKSPNVVTLKAGDKVFDFRLSLISADGLSPAQRESVMKFIKAFSKLGFLSCDIPARLSITYPYDLFRDNMLSGELMFESNLYLCGGSKPVAMFDLLGRTGLESLNELLLRSGLARLDSYVDPKWPKDTADLFIPRIAAETAQKKQLYIYGGQKDPFVDAVLNQASE